jgi:tetratricopeptide (TPR) repeat protein
MKIKLLGRLLVCILTFEGMLLQTARGQSNKPPFPLIGGVKLGKIDYLRFETKPDYQLEEAIRRIPTVQRFIKYEKSQGRELSPRYLYIKSDINADGKLDAFVFFNHSMGSGSGGFHTWVYTKSEKSYQLVSEILHNAALLITPEKTFGWNKILRIPGKINFDPDAFYCTYTRSGENGKYSNECRKIAKDSIISGKLINSPFSRGPSHSLSAKNQHQTVKEQADRHYANNEYPQAIAAYTQAITLSPRYAALYYNRGISYHFSGMKQLAIADLQKAAQLYQEQGKERDYRDTLNQLAKVRH